MRAIASQVVLRRKVKRITSKLEKAYGVPRAEADESVLDSLIGCMLSQNTTDTNSDRAWRNLKARFPSWGAVAKADRRRLEAAIAVAGLGPSRSKRIKRILSYVMKTRGAYTIEFLKDWGNEDAFRYLSALDGVGAKTAAIVLLFAMGRDVFPVDTHIHVIARRLGLVRAGAPRDAVYEAMKPLVPAGRSLSLHLNLIRFGKERCRKRKPTCAGCPLRSECLCVRRSAKA